MTNREVTSLEDLSLWLEAWSEDLAILSADFSEHVGSKFADLEQFNARIELTNFVDCLDKFRGKCSGAKILVDAILSLNPGQPLEWDWNIPD